MIDGYAVFQALKFFSTSFNHEGQEFQLVIVAYIQKENDQDPKILCSAISPSIFVDSRKSAMDLSLIMEAKINSIALPFQPEIINK